MAPFFVHLIILPNINRFSIFFHCQNQKTICDKAILIDLTTPQVDRVEKARPDNAAPNMCIKVFQKTKNCSRCRSSHRHYAIVNFKEVSVAGFQHICSNAACGCRLLVRTNKIGLKEAYGREADVQNVVHCMVSYT